ncbi:MAG: sarcosine oxidase subunit alpha, partial [Candidatus Latescibacterota bacterium]
MRVGQHPILEFRKAREVRFYFNGKEMTGFEGESIASALHASGVKVLSHSVRYGRPRGFFCGIGKCSSCLMTVDGNQNIRTCITPLREGMVVESDRHEIPEDTSRRRLERLR